MFSTERSYSLCVGGVGCENGMPSLICVLFVNFMSIVDSLWGFCPCTRYEMANKKAMFVLLSVIFTLMDV